MKKILIISTGGTFNKVYNPLNGTLEIDKNSYALEKLALKWLCDFKIINIIGKDSLEITDKDRKILLDTINQSDYTHIIIVHGTDTIDITATYLAKNIVDKYLLLTGAMVPYSIDPIEATANLASAYGYLQAIDTKGIYIAMNGIINNYQKVKKDRKNGKFTS
jgi:L-asparaginase